MTQTAKKQSGFFLRTLSTSVIILLGLAVGHAERLPLKTYTTSDGLSDNTINRIVRDSRGFLWFCTSEGLSRFDGYTFTNYGTAEGLPHPNVNDFLETRGGDYWVATSAGLVRFNPKGAPANRPNQSGSRPMFEVIVPADEDRYARYISTIFEAHDGQIWCGTFKGLYRLTANGHQLSLEPVEVGMPSEYSEQRYVNDLVEDRFGSLWLATPSGLYRRWEDGSAARYTSHDGMPGNFLHDLLIDHNGQLWVASREKGFFRIAFDGTHTKPSVALTLTPHDFNQGEWINQLLETSDQKLWAATAQGLLEFIPEGDGEGKLYHLYTPKNGLSGHEITALAEDAGGNLWLASASGTGTMKLVRNGFVTYDEQDGINSVFSIFIDRAGGVGFRGYVIGDKRASVFEGGKVELLNQSQAIYWPHLGYFDSRQLNWFVPDALKQKGFGWVDEGVTLQTQNGEWWVVTGTELYRFPPSDRFIGIKGARPVQVFGKDSILAGRQIFRIFDDSHERLWISTVASSGNGLAIWERETQTLRDLTPTVNLPSLHDELPRSFGDDASGDVWIGFNTGVARFRNGEFTYFTAQDGIPPGAIVDMYTDRQKHLWLASARGGLVRVDNPGAAHPTVSRYTAAEGLSSNVVSTISEDALGHIYVGTGRGLDSLDPATGRIKHYTTADGLAAGEIRAVLCARDGSVWVGTKQGLSHLLPEPEKQSAPPPVLLTGLQLAGAEQQISALGETEIKLSDLPASASQMQIDFVGLGFAPGETLHYQYMLEGADRDWSVPTTQRTVTYPRLASGRYRFLVRAINSDGKVSDKPSVIIFQVLPPVWLRLWFIALVALVGTGAAYLFYRYRVKRLLEVANMRTRIATDLHDDIGANLTKIAILSEVAKQQHRPPNGNEESPLSSIARISRESVASMNDIVWAIDPQRDHLIDLVRRMRREAEELFSARDIELVFQAPGEEQDLRLGVDMRRALFLIFKEAINNAARHSQCHHVTIRFGADARLLALRVTDDGTGFNLDTDDEGHGLENMRQRAAELGGKLTIDSDAGKGTIIDLRVPRSPSKRLFGEKTTAHPV